MYISYFLFGILSSYKSTAIAEMYAIKEGNVGPACGQVRHTGMAHLPQAPSVTYLGHTFLHLLWLGIFL